MWAQTWWLLAAVIAGLVLAKFAADGDHHPISTIHRFVKEHRR